MILSYNDILGDRKRHRIKATVTTDHPLSSYGQPIVLLDYDKQPLGLDSWILLGYQIEKATEAELVLMKKYVGTITLMMDDSAAASKLGRKGGQATSDAKTDANRAKANLPPKPGKKPRGRPKKN